MIFLTTFNHLFFVGGKEISTKNIYFVCDNVKSEVALMQPVLKQVVFNYVGKETSLHRCTRIIISLKTYKVLK